MIVLKHLRFEFDKIHYRFYKLSKSLDLKSRYFKFKSKFKICFDAINNPDLPCPWILLIPRCNILALVEWFSSCSFVWVTRSCNGVAHQAARFAVSSYLSFFFHKDNLPPALLACCKADYPSCTSFF